MHDWKKLKLQVTDCIVEFKHINFNFVTFFEITEITEDAY